MKRIGYPSLAFTAVFMLLIGVSSALAFCVPDSTPTANSAVVVTRTFNDCPTATVNFTNNYPAQIQISETNMDCFGGANLDSWSFAVNGTKAVFGNCNHFMYSGNFVLTGNANCEGGLRVSPWWALDVDGRFMANGANGEIAVFGGRLPFFSFTNAFGNLRYTKGDNIYMQVIYNPHELTAASPATIQYNLGYKGIGYTSGPLPFDLGNINEPEHGFYGLLNPAAVGGYFQLSGGNGLPLGATATWSNIYFLGPEATPSKASTWGKVKALYR